MSKEKLPQLYRRKWINEGEGTAYIVTSAEMHTGFRDKKSRYCDGEIEIKDCYKQMTLEFHYSTQKAYKKRLKKIDLIIKELALLKQFMLDNPPVEVKKTKKTNEDAPDGESIHLSPRILSAGAIVRPVAVRPATKADVAKDIKETS
jgi:hypothetical protein